MSICDLRVGRFATALPAVFALSMLTAQPGTAQQAHTTPRSSTIRHFQSISPTFGPAGTVVQLATRNLPLEYKVHIGYGATRMGFETLFEVRQDMWGDISAEVTVPPSAPWDRAIFFVAFNAIFSPIGLSDPFHVLNENGMLQRTGRITDESETCMTMRDQDDYLYALTGDVAGLSVGDDVTVEGSYSETSSCLDGSAIGVVRVSPVG